MEIIASDSVKPELRDCYNCIHTYGASCKSPAYKAMTPAQQNRFWHEPEAPCSLFEVDKDSPFLNLDPWSDEGVALQERLAANQSN